MSGLGFVGCVFCSFVSVAHSKSFANLAPAGFLAKSDSVGMVQYETEVPLSFPNIPLIHS